MSIIRRLADGKWNNFLTDLTYVGDIPSASAPSSTSIEISFVYDPTVIDSVDVWLLDSTTYALIASLSSVLISPATFGGLSPGSYVGVVRQNPKSTSGYVGQSGPSQPSNVVTLLPPVPAESFITNLIPTGTSLGLSIYNSSMNWYWNSMLQEQEMFRVQVSSNPFVSPAEYGIEIALFKNDGTIDNVTSYRWSNSAVSYMNTGFSAITNNRDIVVPMIFQDSIPNSHLAYFTFNTYMNYPVNSGEFVPNYPNGGYQMMQIVNLPSGGSSTVYILLSYGGNSGVNYGCSLWKLDAVTGAVYQQNEIEYPLALWYGGYNGNIGIDLYTENIAFATVLYDTNYVYYMSTANWNLANAFYNINFWQDVIGGSPSGYPTNSAITPDMFGNIYLLWNNNGVLKLNKIDSTNTVNWQTEFSYPGAYLYKGAVQPIYSGGVVVAVDVVTTYGFSAGPPTYNYNYFINITRLDNSGTPIWSRDFYPTDATGVDNYQADTGNYPAKFNFYNNEWIITGSLSTPGPSPKQFGMSIDTDTAPTVGIYTLAPNAVGQPDNYWAIINGQLTITFGGTPTLTQQGGGYNPTPVNPFYLSYVVNPYTFNYGSADYWNDQF